MPTQIPTSERVAPHPIHQRGEPLGSPEQELFSFPPETVTEGAERYLQGGDRNNSPAADLQAAYEARWQRIAEITGTEERAPEHAADQEREVRGLLGSAAVIKSAMDRRNGITDGSILPPPPPPPRGRAAEYGRKAGRVEQPLPPPPAEAPAVEVGPTARIEEVAELPIPNAPVAESVDRHKPARFGKVGRFATKVMTYLGL